MSDPIAAPRRERIAELLAQFEGNTWSRLNEPSKDRFLKRADRILALLESQRPISEEGGSGLGEGWCACGHNIVRHGLRETLGVGPCHIGDCECKTFRPASPGGSAPPPDATPDDEGWDKVEVEAYLANIPNEWLLIAIKCLDARYDECFRKPFGVGGGSAERVGEIGEGCDRERVGEPDLKAAKALIDKIENQIDAARPIRLPDSQWYPLDRAGALIWDLRTILFVDPLAAAFDRASAADPSPTPPEMRPEGDSAPAPEPETAQIVEWLRSPYRINERWIAADRLEAQAARIAEQDRVIASLGRLVARLARKRAKWKRRALTAMNDYSAPATDSADQGGRPA